MERKEVIRQRGMQRYFLLQYTLRSSMKRLYFQRMTLKKTYPVIESTPLTLDSKCKFCESCDTPTGNVDLELESLIQIKGQMKTDASYIWRYATGVGELQDKDLIENGWFLV